MYIGYIYIFIYRRLDIVDVMLDKLEKYASNLEEIVMKRTSELVDEKKKTDLLLYRMLPQYVFSNTSCKNIFKLTTKPTYMYAILFCYTIIITIRIVGLCRQ